jgi:hypothetical protein
MFCNSGVYRVIKYYRLNDANEVEECDMFKAEEFLCSDKKIVKQEQIGDNFISTVMLTIDHDFLRTGYPILFETMIFPDDSGHESYCARYRTYQEALDGHNAVVQKLQKGLPLNAD